MRRAFYGLIGLSGWLTACGGDWSNQNDYTQPDGGKENPTEPSAHHPQGLHANGNRIEDDAGNVIVLHGVNRSGTEYACVQGGISDGPLDERSVQAIASWNVNAVRVPLNETCWLDINGVPSINAGENYKQAIKDYVALLHRYALIPILELHWTAAGEDIADSQPLVPDRDHAPDLWADVTATFIDDTGVVFEPFNEPVTDRYFEDAADAWACWRDGCTVEERKLGNDYTLPGLEVAGIQDMLNAIRATESAAGAQSHLVIQAGLDWSNDLSGWLAHVPEDPAQNFGAAWHIYADKLCGNPGCWDGAPAEIAASYPLVITELGQKDCEDYFIKQVMDWADARQVGYLGWSWNAFGPCEAGSDQKAWSLITDFYTGRPNSNAYAQTFHDRFAALAAASAE